MSGLDTKKSWEEVLPFLFNLLVENSERIIDDTSVERILEWLKYVCKSKQQLQKLFQCGTVEFMTTEEVFSNPESSAFFLRLFGLLASEEKVFNIFLSVKGGEFLTGFLDKPKNVENLWVEGNVRNGYFQALISLTEHEGGMQWLNNRGLVNCALDYVSDRSMFVASSARSFIATYIIQQSGLVPLVNCQETFHRILDDKNVADVTDRLKLMLSQQYSKFPLSAVAVIEITRMLICKDSTMGQKILQESRLLLECLGVIKIGDATACQKIVDVICEMAKNTRRWGLDWGRLLGTEDLQASKILLDLDFPSHWFFVLCGIVELTLELVSNPSCRNPENVPNGCHVKEEDVLNIGLVDCLLSQDNQQEYHAKIQLQNILAQWIKGDNSTGNSQTKVICQTMAAAQQLIKQACSRHCSFVLHWVKLSLNFIENFADPTKLASVSRQGNQKVLKACLELITSFAEVQSSLGLLESTDPSSVDNLFDELVASLLCLIENSNSVETVISLSLKTLGKVLDSSRDEFVKELFSRREETSPKRARFDGGTPGQASPPEISVKEANRAKLAFLMFRRLRDSRWEVRDSTLEFVESLMRLNNDSVHDFLCYQNIPSIVWDTIDDGDSYVRASAIHVIGLLVCQSQLWSSLLKIGRVTEESLLEKLASVVVKDEEAFPRRNAVDCFTHWIQTRHPMAKKILHTDASSRLNNENTPMDTISDDGNYTETIQRSADAQNMGEFCRVPQHSKIVQSLCHACQDFDWEVKLRGFEFWKAVTGFFSRSNAEKERVNTSETKSFSEESAGHGCEVERAKAEVFDEVCQVLFNMGALDIMIAALNDCDHLVCEKTLEILGGLQVMSYPDNSSEEKCIKTVRQLQDRLAKDFDVGNFMNVLSVIDFPALTQSIEAADSSVRADPVSLIEDILIAASHRDENLLDCY
ncbi:BRCA1-associated ATM activator 1-like isoform X3 [Montipora foliosa]|uniref:BRCA1-associated ATM activator 1-like isoform X3 n=1 Tax=Montipora foliosa TaxID=591990 RepID=UPI0035F19DFC